VEKQSRESNPTPGNNFFRLYLTVGVALRGTAWSLAPLIPILLQLFKTNGFRKHLPPISPLFGMLPKVKEIFFLL
jgi:hypothetical protein